MEEFFKMLIPSALGAIAGYGAIRAEIASMRARVDMVVELLAETRKRVDSFHDSRGQQ
jgi:hypothetical protein